jgi:hypothetical protein
VLGHADMPSEAATAALADQDLRMRVHGPHAIRSGPASGEKQVSPTPDKSGFLSGILAAGFGFRSQCSREAFEAAGGRGTYLLWPQWRLCARPAPRPERLATDGGDRS